MTEDELIGRYLEPNPRRPGLAEWRVKDAGVAVWALVGYYQQAVQCDAARVASDYEVPIEAVQAALAFYRRHKPAVDARIAANVA